MPPQPSEVKPVSPIPLRLVTAAALGLAVIGFATAPAVAEKATKKNFTRDLSKNFDELTPSEQIAIRAAAKAAYKAKKLKSFNVCADPGNMPLSNIEGEGFQQKMAKVLADAMGARVTYSWRPALERGMTRQTFDSDMCDVMFDMPTNYGPLLTTFPVYKTPYVLAYRNDKGLKLTGLDDPKLKDLKIGVFQTSGIRAALAKRGIVDNVKLQTHEPRRRSRARASALVHRAEGARWRHRRRRGVRALRRLGEDHEERADHDPAGQSR